MVTLIPSSTSNTQQEDHLHAKLQYTLYEIYIYRTCLFGEVTLSFTCLKCQDLLLLLHCLYHVYARRNKNLSDIHELPVVWRGGGVVCLAVTFTCPWLLLVPGSWTIIHVLLWFDINCLCLSFNSCDIHFNCKSLFGSDGSCSVFQSRSWE